MADLDMRTIEKGARDLLHVGLGLVHTVQEAGENIGELYADLVTRGAAEQSGTAVRLRGMLDEGLERLRVPPHPYDN